MVNLIIGMVVGGMLAMVLFCIFAINREEIHPKQLEIAIREGLRKDAVFYVTGTNIEVTPWKDGSGIVRLVKRGGDQ